MEMLKLMRAPIEYCSKRESYYYNSEVEFNKELFVLKANAKEIKGGESFFYELWRLHELCSKSQ